MKKNYIIIKCTSYTDVATKLLIYQGKHLHSYEIAKESTKFLILTECILSQNQINILISQTIMETKCNSYAPICTLTSYNRNICYSFKISSLDLQTTPYKYLADTILSLPYRFTKAKTHIDPYGNVFLLLIN
ncbi:hypothetical protein CQ395_08920 [Clostridium neonatale]|uniref:Uncharacterized protein n=1 Tax=Clostridium neonatale TaxID=137838 RepID=A0A2A7MBW8_9CLOT|nr:hypothetical protein CQ395_08920 [Clostridium neonatale]PEG29254.1 hypothetical protein CQ394_17955 [Clostridium neonatale]